MASSSGKKSDQFHLVIGITLKLKLLFLQLDELWSFLRAKPQQLWVFIAVEARSQFWIHFELGSRTNHTAKRLVAPVKRISDFDHGKVLKITTDKLAAYKHALQKHFASSKYHYLPIVKQRFQRRLVTIKKGFVSGTNTDFPNGTQNTSFIERVNLTLRPHVSYLTRTTLGYCQNRVNFKNILLINIYHYNDIQSLSYSTRAHETAQAGWSANGWDCSTRTLVAILRNYQQRANYLNTSTSE